MNVISHELILEVMGNTAQPIGARCLALAIYGMHPALDVHSGRQYPIGLKQCANCADMID